MAHRGCVQGIKGCTGACTESARGCTGDDSENTRSDRGSHGIFIRTGVFRASSVISFVCISIDFFMTILS